MFGPVMEYEAQSRHRELVSQAATWRAYFARSEESANVGRPAGSARRARVGQTVGHAGFVRMAVSRICGWIAVRLNGAAGRLERASHVLAERPHRPGRAA